MPDITMCSGQDCLIKAKCYRFRALPNPYRQSYFMKSPCNEAGTECEHFWAVTKGDRVRSEEKKKEEL